MNEDSMSEKINYHTVVTQRLCDVINVRLNLIDFELGRDEKFENVFQFKTTNWRQFLTKCPFYVNFRLQHKITNKKKFTFMK